MKKFVIFYIVALSTFPLLGDQLRVDIVLSVLVMPVLLFFLENEKEPRKVVLWIFLPYLFFLVFSSIFYRILLSSFEDFDSYNVLVLVQGQLRFFIVLYFFLLVLYLKIINSSLVLKFLFAFSILISLLGLIQTFSSLINNFIVKYYISITQLSNTEDYLALVNYRPISIIGQPAYFSIILLLSTMFILNYLNKSNVVIKILLLIILAIIFYTGIISGSKAFYLGLPLYLIFFLFTRSSLSSAFLILSIGLLLFFSLTSIIKIIDISYVSYYFDRFREEGLAFAFRSRFGEKGFLIESIEFLKSNYFLGSGVFSKKNIFVGDNLYVSLIFRVSIIGVIIFIGTILYWMVLFIKSFRKTKNQYFVIAADTIFIYIITGMGCPSIFGPRVMEFFIIIFAIGINQYLLLKKSKLEI